MVPLIRSNTSSNISHTSFIMLHLLTTTYRHRSWSKRRPKGKEGKEGKVVRRMVMRMVIRIVRRIVRRIFRRIVRRIVRRNINCSDCSE